MRSARLQAGRPSSARALPALARAAGERVALAMAGIGWLSAIVLDHGTGASPWTLAPAFFVMGLGVGSCFGTLFDVTLGDVRGDEAGSAGGSLSAVQQLATAPGAAAMTTVYFRTLETSGQAHALTVSLGVVGAVTILCCGPVWLLPRAARVENGEAKGHLPDARAVELGGGSSTGYAEALAKIGKRSDSGNPD